MFDVSEFKNASRATQFVSRPSYMHLYSKPKPMHLAPSYIIWCADDPLLQHYEDRSWKPGWFGLHFKSVMKNWTMSMSPWCAATCKGVFFVVSKGVRSFIESYFSTSPPISQPPSAFCKIARGVFTTCNPCTVYIQIPATPSKHLRSHATCTCLSPGTT